jgi:acyl-ACP thioesterase
MTWVLARQCWQLSEVVAMGDELRVQTWPSGIDRWAALRDFRIIKDDRPIGWSITSWFILDLATRRPVRPNSILRSQFHAQTEHVAPVPIEPLPELAAPFDEREFSVRYSDIDVNRHVTNASYVEWALEMVDQPTWCGSRLSGLDVQYLAECELGSRVFARSAAQVGGRRLHSIVHASDNKELARVVSVWQPRPGGSSWQPTSGSERP